MSGAHTRVGAISKWVRDINQKSIITNINWSASAGVVVPEGHRHEYVHLAATKVNTVTLKVWGYNNVANGPSNWAQVDVVTFTEENDEVALLIGASAFLRLQTSINANSTTNVNTFFGFSE